jgi:hypothetical protein
LVGNPETGILDDHFRVARDSGAIQKNGGQLRKAIDLVILLVLALVACAINNSLPSTLGLLRGLPVIGSREALSGIDCLIFNERIDPPTASGRDGAIG